MKKLILLTVLSASILFVGYPVQAATLTVDVDGLENLGPLGVISYQLNFDIGGTGAGVSDVVFSHQPSTFWSGSTSALPGAVSTTLITTGDNGYDPVPAEFLDNGTLFTVTYDDQSTLLLVFQNFVFSDFSEGGLFSLPPNTTFGAGDNLLTMSTTAVPIPPTVLLLGAGLVGLVGIRRRVKS